MAKKSGGSKVKGAPATPIQLRLGGELDAEARAAAKRAGMPFAAYIRDAVRRQVGHQGTATALEEFEKKVSAMLGRVHSEIRRVDETSQILYAQQDALVKLFMVCVPEPPDKKSLEASVAVSRKRYERFVQAAARTFNDRDFDQFRAIVSPDAKKDEA